MKIYDWSKVNLKELQKEKLIFIAGSRDLSPKRIGQIIIENTKKGPIIFGTSKEDFINGFENQEQFKTLSLEKLEKVIKKIETLKLPNSVDILHYSQSDLLEILEKINFYKVRFINGSWKIVFHRREEFKVLEKKNIYPKLISAFADESDAKLYAENFERNINIYNYFDLNQKYSDKELLNIADKIATNSFDYTWQTGCVIAKEGKILAYGHNRVLPYETHAMFNGSLREKNKSEINDLNNYDTIHAEMDAITYALNNKVDLTGATLYINLLPCPNCARVLSRTGIKEIIYVTEHYGAYAIELFMSSRKSVRKFSI